MSYPLEPISGFLAKGRVHPGQVAISSQGWHLETNKHPNSHLHLWASLEWPINLIPSLHDFGTWEKARVPENMQTPYWKVLTWNRTQEFLRQCCYKQHIFKSCAYKLCRKNTSKLNRHQKERHPYRFCWLKL